MADDIKKEVKDIVDNIPDKMKEEHNEEKKEDAKEDFKVALTPSADGKSHCPRCANVLKHHFSPLHPTGAWVCPVCGWTKALMPQKTNDPVHNALAKVKVFMPYIGMGIGFVLFTLYMIFAGLLSGGPLKWFFVLGFIAILAFALKKKSPLLKWVSGLSVVAMAAVVILGSSILAPGNLISESLRKVGIESDSASIGALAFSKIGGALIDIKCGFKDYQKGLSLSSDGIVGSNAIDPDCEDPLIDSEKNKQVGKYDVRIVEFVSNEEDKRIIMGSQTSFKLDLANDGDEPIDVNIKFGLPEMPKLEMVSDPTLGCNIVTNECVVRLLPKTSNNPMVFLMQHTGNDTGSAEVVVNVSYSTNVTTSLLLKATKDINKRGLEDIDSITSPGSANLIPKTQKQPLYYGSPFAFTLVIANNDPTKGIIENPHVELLVPHSIVDYTTSQCFPSGRITLDKVPSSQCGYEVTNKQNYFCLKLVTTGRIANTRKFECLMQVNKSLPNYLESNIVGILQYRHSIAVAENVLVETVVG